VRFFPFTSLSIGAVQVNVGEYRNAQDVANAAASAKHAAKMSAGGLARYRHAVQPVRLPETSAS